VNTAASIHGVRPFGIVKARPLCTECGNALDARNHCASCSDRTRADAEHDGREPPVAQLAPKGSVFAWVGVDDIFAPLPPTKWIVPGLQLCPGRPATIAAFGASGKTIAMQSALLSCAASIPVWGRFAVPTPLRVKHIDHEQGRHATLKRYQRLALGLGITREHLGDRVAVSLFPNVYLNQSSAEDVYARECEGTDLVLIDALRGATPGEDENDSKIRSCLDVLTRVSEKTGAAFVVLHHAGKPKTDASSDSRFTGRGTSAIYDASGCQLVITGEKGAPKLVTQAKMPAEGEGRGVDDFTITIDDVADGANPTAGVRVLAADVPEKKSGGSKFAQLRANIIECVRRNPGCAKNQIRTDVSGRAADILELVDALVEEGVIAKLGTDLRPTFRLRVPS
jgi:hypothetical protein